MRNTLWLIPYCLIPYCLASEMNVLSKPIVELPPTEIHHWVTHSITIPNEGDLEPINICDAFNLQKLNHSWAIGAKGSFFLLLSILHSSISNPSFAKTITTAAEEQQSIQLNRGRTQKREEAKGTTYFYLACNKHFIHKPNKVSEEDKENELARLPTKGCSIVNKNSTNRGPEGRCGKKRSQTSHPISLKDKCSFSIRIGLQNGVHWFIPHQKIENKFHNHAPKNFNTERCPMSCLTHRKSVIMPHCSAEFATAVLPKR